MPEREEAPQEVTYLRLRRGVEAVQEPSEAGLPGPGGPGRPAEAHLDCRRRPQAQGRWRRHGRAVAPPRSLLRLAAEHSAGPRRPSGPVPGSGARAERRRPVSAPWPCGSLTCCAVLRTMASSSRGLGQVAVRGGAEGDPLHRAPAGGDDVGHPLPAVQQARRGRPPGKGATSESTRSCGFSRCTMSVYQNPALRQTPAGSRRGDQQVLPLQPSGPSTGTGSATICALRRSRPIRQAGVAAPVAPEVSRS